jgi:hypothetical protein
LGPPPPTPPWTLAANVGGGGGTMVPWGGGPWAIGRYGRRNVERAEEMGAVVCSSQGVVAVPCRAFNGAHSLTHSVSEGPTQ